MFANISTCKTQCLVVIFIPFMFFGEFVQLIKEMHCTIIKTNVYFLICWNNNILNAEEEKEDL